MGNGIHNINMYAARVQSHQNGDVPSVHGELYSYYGVYVALIHYIGATGINDFNSIVRETTFMEFLNGSENFNVCTFLQIPQKLLVQKDSKHKLFQLWQVIKAAIILCSTTENILLYGAGWVLRIHFKLITFLTSSHIF